MYNCSVRDLLYEATQGKLELLTPVSTDAFVGVKHSEFNNHFVYRHNEGSVPELVVLGPSNCQDLYLKRKTGLCEFSKGYTISRGSLVETSIKTAEKSSAAHPMSWAHFKFIEENGNNVAQRVVEEVTTDMLYISRDGSEEIFDYIGRKFKAQYDYWLDSELDILARAAAKFWNGTKVNLTDSSTYPKTEDVIQYFEKRKVSKTDAKTFARIIRPVAAINGNRKKLDDDFDSNIKTKKVSKTKTGLIHKIK